MTFIGELISSSFQRCYLPKLSLFVVRAEKSQVNRDYAVIPTCYNDHIEDHRTCQSSKPTGLDIQYLQFSSTAPDDIFAAAAQAKATPG